MSEIHETLEQAEHVGHGGGHSDPMMMRVAMTMAIIAATLAAVSVKKDRNCFSPPGTISSAWTRER